MDNKFYFRIWDPKNEDIIPQFLDVFRAAFGTPKVSSKDIFLWKHRDNPAGSSIISYAVDVTTNQVAAVRTFVPRRIVFNSNGQLGFEACEASTRPNYARQGLFTRNMQRCIEIGESMNGYSLIGSPNSNSIPGYLKVGCKNIGGIERLVKPLRILKTGFAYLLNMQNLRNFTFNPNIILNPATTKKTLPDDIDELLNIRNKWQGVWAGYRTRELLEYRFISHPFYSYEIYDFVDGIAFMLFGNRGPLCEGRIVEVFFRTSDQKITQSIKQLYKKISKDYNLDLLSIVLSVNHPYYTAFRVAGFLKAPSIISFYTYTFKNCPKEYANKPWAIIGADFDTY